MANEEQQVFILDDDVLTPNGQANGRIKIVTASGFLAIPNTPLPTGNGDYTLRVTGGPEAPVYTWALEGT